MATIQVQAAADHLQRLIGKRPVVGVSELIWNALDAEATTVSVDVEVTEAGAVDRVRVLDDGHGFTAEEVEELFASVGGSWKQRKADRRSRTGKRELHGQKGEGRWKALAVGDRVTWESVAVHTDGGRFRTRLTMTAESPHQAEWTGPDATTDPPGTSVTIVAGLKEPNALQRADTVGSLCGTFALFLSRHPEVSIFFNNARLDPASLQTHRAEIDLIAGVDEGPARLTIIEWSVDQARELCLCDDNFATLEQIEPGIKAPGFYFTAYISWAGFRAHEELLGLADLGAPELAPVINEARDRMRAYFRERREEQHRTTIEEWRDEDVYPFEEEPEEPVAQATQAIFNYVAVSASSAVNAITDPKAKRMSLETIKLAVEADPGSLEHIIREVLKLPAEKVNEFRELLDKTSLTAILSTTRLVASRLELIAGLKQLLFDPDVSPTVLERAHLHKIVEDSPWIFGEEFATHVSDQSLTTLLRTHLKLLGRTPEDEVGPVTDLAGNDRRIDFLFGRALELNQNVREHLVVEIKRPTVLIGRKETDQIEDYAEAVATDPRFDLHRTRWTFVVVGVTTKPEIEPRITPSGKPRGLLVDPEGGHYRVWVRTWGEILQECEHRLKFVRNELAYDPAGDQAMAFLRATYPDYLPAGLRDPK